MSLIRYQSPEAMAWPSLDRWSSLRDDLNSLFELPFGSSFARQGQLFGGWSPALDLYQDKDNVETGDGYTLEVEMPGVNKDGLEISVENNELTIVGRRSRPGVEGKLIHRESRPENYRRTFELDPSIDAEKIGAKIDQGVVTLTLPKAEHVKPRKIAVS